MIRNPLNNENITLKSEKGQNLLEHYRKLLENQSGGKKKTKTKTNKCPILEIKSKKTCGKEKITSLLNLDKIRIVKNSFKNCTEINLNDEYFKYDSIDLCKFKFINQGGFGKVYSISDKTGKYQIALKTYFNPKDDEIEIIKHLQKKNIDCNLINSKLITTKDKEIISIMNLMTGNLQQLPKLSKNKNLKIIKQIAIILQYLFYHKLVYIDLKAENILYKCHDKETFKLVMGDLGSLCNFNKKTISVTWTPWENRKNQNVKCNEKSLIWSLGVVLLELLKYEKVFHAFHWSAIEYAGKNKKQEKEVLDDINIAIQKYEKEYPILKKMLEFDLKKRITLQEIIDQIN